MSCRKTGECLLTDDFKAVLEKTVEADGIILASPVYFGSTTPQTKVLIDRAGYFSIAKGRVFENKVGGATVVARRVGHNFTLAPLLFFFPPSGNDRSKINLLEHGVWQRKGRSSQRLGRLKHG